MTVLKLAQDTGRPDAADRAPALRARWESEGRWYEVLVARDLLGDYVLQRHWGSLTSALGGSMMELVFNEAAAQERIAQIDNERRASKPPYRRVF